MSLEIVKQLYDIGTLYEYASSLDTIRTTYGRVVEIESYYRGLNNAPDSVAMDTIGTALTISSRGTLGLGDSDRLHSGIRKLKSFVFSENYTPMIAATHAARAAYLAATIQDSQAERLLPFGSPESVANLIIPQREFSKLNKLKKTNPEAMFYWYHVLHILENAGKLETFFKSGHAQ